MNEYPNVEIAVQASPSKIAPGTARRVWFDTLMHAVRNNPRKLNLALHVNMAYCDQMCRGTIPADLFTWFLARREDYSPVITRWQINFSGSKTEFLDYPAMTRMFAMHPEREFIMQDNSSTTSGTHLARLRACMLTPSYSVLYDQSSGNGILAQQWARPHTDVRTGYSGGLKPENVAAQLDKIAAVVRDDTIWIDAEGGLKTPGTKTFDLSRARAYIDATNAWCQKNR